MKQEMTGWQWHQVNYVLTFTKLATYSASVVTARSELRKVLLFGAVTFLFVYEISREPLNGFRPNSLEKRAWSLAWSSMNAKVKGQRSRSSGTENRFFGGYLGNR